MSRNEREGRYIGKWMGRHVRERGAQRLAPGFRFGARAAMLSLHARGKPWFSLGPNRAARKRAALARGHDLARIGDKLATFHLTLGRNP